MSSDTAKPFSAGAGRKERRRLMRSKPALLCRLPAVLMAALMAAQSAAIPTAELCDVWAVAKRNGSSAGSHGDAAMESGTGGGESEAVGVASRQLPSDINGFEALHRHSATP
ncbi:hypothetical protein C8R45DRAFT_935310 [Mycena sanguinolenta]|nr:hypothetical protein C8R45DRAFT_935310 [Mycena sanguinolenta]